MAGYREFQTGEVLTAANVNDFLMDQSVMKFADAAARDTALGTAVGGANALREGMVAYLDSTDEVQFFDGTLWGPVGAEPPAGIGSNVVQAVKTDTFVSSSTSYVDITGLSVTITPTTATSKILLIAQLSVTGDGGVDDGGTYRIIGGNATNYVGDAAGSRVRGVFAVTGRGSNTTFDGNSIIYLDSPATTSPVTYQVQGVTLLDAFKVNRGNLDADTAANARGASSITAIEVAV